MKNNHIVELDSWRGIMALLVAIFHYTVPNNFVSAELAVDFFFVLSGIVIQKSYFDKNMSVTGFFKKRVYRLYPLHLFALLILLVLFLGTIIFMHYPKNGDIVTSFGWQFPSDYYKDGVVFTFLQQLLFVNGLGFHPHHQYWNGASWSVSCELWVNLIFFIWLRKLSIPLVLLMAMFLYSILFVIFGRLGVHNEYVMYINSGMIRCLASFSLGVVLYRWLSPLKDKYNTIGYVSILYSILQILSCIVIFYVMFSNSHNYNDFLALIFILVTIAISFLQFNTILRYKILIFLGKISYSIYLMHYSVQYIMQSLLGMRFDYSLNGYVNLSIFILSSILIGFISYYYIEKNSQSIMDKISHKFKVVR